MATKPSKKPAAPAKAGSTSQPTKASDKTTDKAATKAHPAKKSALPPAQKAPVKTEAAKGKPASQPAKKPAAAPAKVTKPTSGTPVPSSVKKSATANDVQAPAAAPKAKATEKKATVKAEAASKPAPAAKAKAESKVEVKEVKEVKPAKPTKADSKASKALTPPPLPSKPVPPPKIKKPILDSAPEVVIKQAYNPAKMPPFIKKQQQRLYELRNALLDSMDIVAKDSLRNRPEGSEASVGGMHMADAGSDAYDRDFALSMLSKEQDALYEINEALERVDQGVYGVCELSGDKINDERLEALPYTRYTREMQELIERDQMGGRLRRAPVRSVFGLEEDGEEGEDGEEEDRPANNNQSESSLDFMKE